MKKIFTLLAVMMLVFAGANAQERKTWDFTKGVSEESRAMLDADGAQWTKSANGEGVSTGWATINAVEGELKAGGVVIPEFAYLQFKQFAAGNAVNYLVNKLRLQKNCAFDLPALSAGQKIVIKAQSANATATNRGLGFTNVEIVGGPEDGICLGRDAEGAPAGGVTTFELNVLTDGIVTVSTGVNGAPASGVEILSIIIDEGDKNIKKWNFTWSEATKAQVLAAADWTKAESASKEYITGDEIRWNLEVNVDANNDLTAGGEAIKELKGLRHNGLGAYGYGIAFDYGTTTDGNNWGPYNAGSYLWVTGAASTITVPNVKAGSTFKLGVETHKLIPTGTSDARGFQVLVGGVEVGATQKATDYKEFEYTIPADGDEYVDVVLKATKGCHLYSIEAEVKDEAVVDKNSKLGNPKFDGIPVGKVNPDQAEGFTMTFPQSQNIAADVAITIDGYFGPAGLEGEEADEYRFDGVAGTIGEGISFTFSDYLTLEENSAYEFYLTNLSVDGYEALNKVAAEGEKLYGFTFETVGPGIDEPREWNFTLTVEDAEAIAQSIDAGKTYWIASSKGRYSYANPITYKQLMVNDETPLACTAGLYFSMGTANDILIGTPAHTGVGGAANAGGNNGKLQLGGGIPKLIIPQCSAGDEVTIKALYSTKGTTEQITLTNGICDESNIITVGGSAAEFKITVIENGDLVLASKGVVYNSISVFPSAIEKEQIDYVISAVDAEGMPIKTLAEGTGETNDNVALYYPYFLADAEGNVWTNGARGSEFKTAVTLVSGQTDYFVQYKKKELEGFIKAVYVAEAEEIPGVTPWGMDQYNTGIRASQGKAGYITEDVTLLTLQPGTYMVYAAVYDATKGGGTTIINLTCGEQKGEIYSTGDNMSEVYLNAPFVVTEATPLVWNAEGCNESGHGLDAIIVYEYDETATGINNATIATKLANGKFLNGNGIVIVKNGVKYNALGIEVK